MTTTHLECGMIVVLYARCHNVFVYYTHVFLLYYIEQPTHSLSISPVN